MEVEREGDKQHYIEFKDMVYAAVKIERNMRKGGNTSYSMV